MFDRSDRAAPGCRESWGLHGHKLALSAVVSGCPKPIIGLCKVGRPVRYHAVLSCNLEVFANPASAGSVTIPWSGNRVGLPHLNIEAPADDGWRIRARGHVVLYGHWAGCSPRYSAPSAERKFAAAVPDGPPQGVESCLGFRELENAGAPPVMIHRHWGTALAWRPRFQPWCRHRAAAHAAVCRRCAAGNHAQAAAPSEESK